MSRIALTFSGQGSQRRGMGIAWTQHPGWEVVAEAGAVTGRDVAALLLDADTATLRRTDNAQLATLVLELVILRELRAAGIDAGRVVGCAGHSIGEYAALVAAGLLDELTAVRLVDVRGRAMRAAAAAREGTMLVVLGLDDEEVRRVVDELAAPPRSAPVWVANLNAPGQVVLSGAPVALREAGSAAVVAGALKCVTIPVGGAFHSPFMAPAVRLLGTALDHAELHDGRMPVVANVDARSHRAARSWRSLLTEQVVAPVLWRESLEVLAGPLGADHLVEIGPGRVLTGFAKRCLHDVTTVSCAVPKEIDALGSLLAAGAAR